MSDYFADLIASADAAPPTTRPYDHLPRAAPPTLLGNLRAPLVYAVAIVLGLLVLALAVTAPGGLLPAVLTILAGVSLVYNVVRLVQSVQVRGDPRFPLLPRAGSDAGDASIVDVDGVLDVFAADPTAVVDAAKDRAAAVILALTHSWRTSHRLSLLSKVRAAVAERMAPGEEFLIAARVRVRPVPIPFTARSRWIVVTDRRILCFRHQSGDGVGPLVQALDRRGLTVCEWFRGWASELHQWVLLVCSPDGSSLRMSFDPYWRDEAVHVAGILGNLGKADRREETRRAEAVDAS